MNIPKFLTGLMCNSTFKFNNERGQVLIINDGALGDYIHGLPFAYSLRNLGYDVTIITSEKNKVDDTFTIIPHYDIINDKRFKMVFVMNYKRPIFLNLLTSNAFDFNFNRIKQKITKQWEEIHWSDFYLKTLSNFVNKTLFFTNGTRVESKETIVFHPGSSNPEKNWDIENFINVYNNIKYSNKTFVLGPADLYLEPKLKNARCNYIKSDSLNQLEKLAKKTKLFIGSDSGVAHYFSTFNCDMISIFTVGCGHTHFPYTRRGYFYFEENVFQKFFKKGKITKIKLTPIELLKQIIHVLEKDNKVEPGFFRSSDKAHYLI